MWLGRGAVESAARVLVADAGSRFGTRMNLEVGWVGIVVSVDEGVDERVVAITVW